MDNHHIFGNNSPQRYQREVNPIEEMSKTVKDVTQKK